MAQIKDRALHFCEIILKRIWILSFAGVFSALAAAITWRDELLSPETAQKYRVLNMVPHWEWGWWALISAAVILVILIDGSFRVHADLKKKHAEIEARFREREQRKQTRVALGGFLSEGQSFMNRCADEASPPPDEEANAWAQKIETYFLANLDESYIARFRDGSNLPMAATSIVSLTHRNLWSGLRVRLARLQEFIRELSND